MIATVLIDDEQSARDNLKVIIGEYCKKVNIVGEADSVEKAVELINKVQPELIMLDIDIFGGTGFDVLNQIEYQRYKIIFITAFNDFAIKAIKFSAFDYILKPFKPSELVNSINKLVEEKIDKNYSAKIEAVLSNFNSSLPGMKKIVLKTSDKIHIVNIKDILYCEAESNYTNFYLNNGIKILVSKPIKKFAEMLVDMSFIRPHQSYLVNIDYIQHFDKSEGGALIMSNKKQIPVSQRQKTTILEFIDKL